MPHVKLNGVNLYYEENGSGTPVLMLHGFAGTTRMWDPQVKPFSQKYRFITCDMRGHGQSESPKDVSQYAESLIVEDQYQLLRHLGIAKAVISGLSVGGYMTLKFYEAHPEMCLALILCDTGPGYRTPEAAAGWNKTSQDRAALLEKGGIEAFMKSEYSRSDYYTTPEVMRKHNPMGLALFSRGGMVNPAAIQVLDKIKVPTLILVGDGDQPFLFSSEYMQKRIPNSELVVLKNAGHGSNVDQPEKFNDAIFTFLEKSGIKARR